MLHRSSNHNRIAKGKLGEAYAVSYLEQLHYKILAQNWRCRLGELDLIAEHEGHLVFIEVRARSSSQYGTAVESVDDRKQHRVRQVAQAYMNAVRLHHMPIRFDVVAIRLSPDGSLDKLDHYIGAF